MRKHVGHQGKCIDSLIEKESIPFAGNEIEVAVEGQGVGTHRDGPVTCCSQGNPRNPTQKSTNKALRQGVGYKIEVTWHNCMD